MTDTVRHHDETTGKRGARVIGLLIFYEIFSFPFMKIANLLKLLNLLNLLKLTKFTEID